VTDATKPEIPPAGGWEALAAVGRALREQGAIVGARALLKTNQPQGFDCPGCAWPDPSPTSSFEFCENGAKAVAWEATQKTIGPEFFATHAVSALREQSDHWLEAQGRLTHPLRYNGRTDHYEPVGWDEAYEFIGARLRALPSPDAAAFYTSGRTSNEAAFLWQLFVREFGTNNLPDCSNLCHEASSIGLPQSIGVGKGTVTLADFALADCLISFGHNPGSNHPRMLATLREIARRGAPILVFNPMRERGLVGFRSPKHAGDLLGGGTDLATHYFQPRVGTDHRVLQGLMKRLVELDGAVDTDFVRDHTTGFGELATQLRGLDWAKICEGTGLTRAEFDTAARVYAAAPTAIVAYGMGVTQHRHGTGTVQQIANLLLLRGNIGRPGAGICPVRGHSNVQGDRSVGINERPPPDFLDRLEAATGITAPRRHGVTVVECIEAIRRGEIRALIALGGNIAMAAPDPVATHAALGSIGLFAAISTKLNRSHLVPRHDALILPCLGRSDRDVQAGGDQSVTVEDSMSMVHASRGFRTPVSAHLRSEPAIVAGIARAALPASRVRWSWLIEDYDRIRELIERVVPGFDDYNRRIRAPGGFHLDNAAAERRWLTPSGKARFIPFDAAAATAAPPGFPLRLTTVRSHDQYNTTVYSANDRYRGVAGRRNVVFMNAEDLAALGLRDGEAVDVTAPGEGADPRRLRSFTAIAHPVARGCCAAYFPEATPLVALGDHDPASFTPAFKSIWVRVERAVLLS
jgi:molybdopterin-dependent oxidoreductase alpha subunit